MEKDLQTQLNPPIRNEKRNFAASETQVLIKGRSENHLRVRRISERGNGLLEIEVIEAGISPFGRN